MPNARTLVERRTAFFSEADALSHSLSPELNADTKLLVLHEELVRLEHELVAQGNASDAPKSVDGPDATADDLALAPRTADGDSADGHRGIAADAAGALPGGDLVPPSPHHGCQRPDARRRAANERNGCRESSAAWWMRWKGTRRSR